MNKPVTVSINGTHHTLRFHTHRAPIWRRVWAWLLEPCIEL